MPVKIENLSYIYSPKTPFEKKALDSVSFEIRDGDFFRIVGHTGSGKSTLIGHLNALTRVTSGTVVIDEFDLSVKKIDYKGLRKRVGMVFQYPEYQLFDETVLKDVMFGCKNVGMKEGEARASAYAALTAVGLDADAVAERSPFELSGGQKRRVAIAGVIAMQPKILILDEPTAGLDPRGKHEILELIGKIKQTCPTIVMISHNMDEIARCCNRLAVLSGGKLLGVFEPRELFSKRELLEQAHLEMPTVTALANKLADGGLPVRRDIMTEEELIDEILAAKGVRRA